jgi:GGDEF domain-containing protein
MALTSIKRFLAKSEEEAAYRRVICMLLDGVATHALDLGRDSRQDFRRRLGGIREGIASETTVANLLGSAGAAVQAIGEYSRDAGRVMQAQGTEMQEMIGMLARTVIAIGGVGGSGVARLRQLGDDVEHAVYADDVSSLKAALRDCLGAIRAEAKQQEDASEALVQSLRVEISRKQGLDPVTQLPCEAAARTQFVSTLATAEAKHVGVFVLGTARHINLRFGRAAGDDAIAGLKQILVRVLESGDRLFRWSGPAIVALMASGEPIDRVRARLNRFLDKPIQQRFDSERGPESVPLSIAWSVFPLCSPLAVANRQIHEFVASQGYGDEGSITI